MGVKFYLFLVVTSFSLSLIGQVKIGGNPLFMDSTSILELESNNKGLLLPRITLISTDSIKPFFVNPKFGTVIYNTNKNIKGSGFRPATGVGIYVWDSLGWRSSISSGDKEFLDPRDFGAKVDGVTNDALALQATIDAAGSGGIIKWKGSLAIAGIVNCKAGITITGINNKVSKLIFLNPSASLWAINTPNVTIQDLTIKQSHSLNTANNGITLGSTGFNILRDSFVNLVKGVYVYKWFLIDNLTVNESDFNNCTYGIYAERLNNSFVSNNTFNLIGYGSVVFLAGNDNNIFNNEITGGIVGISCIYRWDMNERYGAFNNRIINNTLRNIKEENISFDVNASTANNNSVRLAGLITSKSIVGGSFNVQISKTTVNDFSNAYLVFSSGILKGCPFQIIINSGSNFQLLINDSSFNSIDFSDSFVIGIPALNWLIQGNTIYLKSDTTYVRGVFLYGFSYGCKIISNSVFNTSRVSKGKSGISITSLNSLAGDVYAPCEYNTCTGNTLQNCNLNVDYFNWGGFPDFNSKGNLVLGNIVTGGRIVFERQLSFGYYVDILNAFAQ